MQVDVRKQRADTSALWYAFLAPCHGSILQHACIEPLFNVSQDALVRYAVLDENKHQLGWIAERSGGPGAWLKRFFLRSHRGFEIDVMDAAGQVLLHLSRGFFFFFSSLDVASPEGERFGTVERRFGIVYKIYHLHDATGIRFAEVKAPRWRFWTFPIYDSGGNPRGSIAKKWGGALREIFTDADTYRVELAPMPWTDVQRVVLLAAAVSIDFDFFENNQGSGDGGVFNVFD